MTSPKNKNINNSQKNDSQTTDKKDENVAQEIPIPDRITHDPLQVMYKGNPSVSMYPATECLEIRILEKKPLHVRRWAKQKSGNVSGIRILSIKDGAIYKMKSKRKTRTK